MRRQEKSRDRTNAGIRKHNKSNSKLVISSDDMSIDSSLSSDAEPSSNYRKRKQYTIAEKKNIVQKYYDLIDDDPTIGKKKAADQLGVPKTSLIEWIDLFPYLIAEKGGSHRFRLEGAGRLPETLEIEPELLKFIEEQRRLDIGLTTNEIIFKVMELDESLKGKPFQLFILGVISS